MKEIIGVGRSEKKGVSSDSLRHKQGRSQVGKVSFVKHKKLYLTLNWMEKNGVGRIAWVRYSASNIQITQQQIVVASLGGLNRKA